LALEPRRSPFHPRDCQIRELAARFDNLQRALTEEAARRKMKNL
jgi:hypothetical protein